MVGIKPTTVKWAARIVVKSISSYWRHVALYVNYGVERTVTLQGVMQTQCMLTS
jgi:hypothetical protein